MRPRISIDSTSSGELVGFGYLTRAEGRYRIPDALPARGANESQEVPAHETELVFGRSATSQRAPRDSGIDQGPR